MHYSNWVNPLVFNLLGLGLLALGLLQINLIFKTKYGERRYEQDMQYALIGDLISSIGKDNYIFLLKLNRILGLVLAVFFEVYVIIGTIAWLLGKE